MTQARDAYHHGDLRNALVASAVRLIEASGPGALMSALTEKRAILDRPTRPEGAGVRSPEPAGLM